MSTSPIQHAAAVTRKPWFKRTLLGLGALLLIFGLLGYFALPGIVKSQVEKLATEKLHRQLSIEKIQFSPYALALTIHGAKLLEPDGKAIFGAFDNLYVNVSAQSLFRLAPVIEEARLDKPYVHLVRNAENHYNIDDILKLIDSQPPSPTQEPARFAAYNLQVEGGRIEFEDEPVKAKHLVSEINLGVPFVSSLPSQLKIFVEPLFSAKIDNAPLKLKGKASPFAEPKEASLDLNLDDVDLTRYVEYLPFEPRFKLPSAKLDVHLSAIFRQAKEQGPVLVLKGTTALKSIVVTELDGKPLIKLPQLAVTLGELNVFSSRLDIAHVLVDHPEVEVVKHADSSINLERLAPPEQKNKTKSATETAPDSKNSPAPTSGLQLVLGELAIQSAHVSYSDEQAIRPLHGGVDKFDLRVKKTDVDLQKHTVNIGAITSSSAEFSLLNEKPIAGKTPVPSAEAKKVQAKTDTKVKADNAAPSYTFNIDTIDIDNWSLRAEDRGQPQAAVTTVSAINLGAQNISNTVGKPGHIDLKASVNKKGQLAVTGDIGLAPLHSDLALDLKSVDLMPLQPYITDKVNLLITRAALSIKGALKLDEASDGKLKGGFKGDLAIVDLATVDKVTSNDFLRWKSLSFGGMDVQLLPLSVNIEQIALNDFFARIIIDADGRINLQDIARSSPDEVKSLTDNKAKTSSSSPAPSPPPPVVADNAETAAPTALPPIKIRKIKMQGGQVRFSDNFIKPNYTAELMDMGGNVSGLSSDAASTADVDLHGQVNSAPLTIVGRVNPLKNDLFLDIKAAVKGMELTPLSPYSGKYIGYGIEKGKLSFEVAYHLENRKLEAQNRVILDQLTLGNKIESPSATTLPVQLALSLLSDRNGVIDINLPIGGSLDDPQFSVGGIIIKVIVNLIAKAATAPFALLGSMFGGGEELSWLAFDPGRSTLLAEGETKLNALAKALNDRPALKLDITGHYDAATDLDGLRRASIDRKVRSLKLKQLVSKGESADVNAIAITSDEYPVLLEKVYKNEDFTKPRNLVGLQKDLPVEEMEKLMMKNAKAGDSDLLTLANQRAQTVKDWLMKNGAVPAERIFILAAKPVDDGGKTKPNRVDFSLH